MGEGCMLSSELMGCLILFSIDGLRLFAEVILQS